MSKQNGFISPIAFHKKANKKKTHTQQNRENHPFPVVSKINECNGTQIWVVFILFFYCSANPHPKKTFQYILSKEVPQKKHKKKTHTIYTDIKYRFGDTQVTQEEIDLQTQLYHGGMMPSQQQKTSERQQYLKTMRDLAKKRGWLQFWEENQDIGIIFFYFCIFCIFVAFLVFFCFFFLFLFFVVAVFRNKNCFFRTLQTQDKQTPILQYIARKDNLFFEICFGNMKKSLYFYFLSIRGISYVCAKRTHSDISCVAQKKKYSVLFIVFKTYFRKKIVFLWLCIEGLMFVCVCCLQCVFLQNKTGKQKKNKKTQNINTKQKTNKNRRYVDSTFPKYERF